MRPKHPSSPSACKVSRPLRGRRLALKWPSRESLPLLSPGSITRTSWNLLQTSKSPGKASNACLLFLKYLTTMRESIQWGQRILQEWRPVRHSSLSRVSWKKFLCFKQNFMSTQIGLRHRAVLLWSCNKELTQIPCNVTQLIPLKREHEGFILQLFQIIHSSVYYFLEENLPITRPLNRTLKVRAKKREGDKWKKKKM